MGGEEEKKRRKERASDVYLECLLNLVVLGKGSRQLRQSSSSHLREVVSNQRVILHNPKQREREREGCRERERETREREKSSMISNVMNYFITLKIISLTFSCEI